MSDQLPKQQNEDTGHVEEPTAMVAEPASQALEADHPVSSEVVEAPSTAEPRAAIEPTASEDTEQNATEEASFFNPNDAHEASRAAPLDGARAGEEAAQMIAT